MIALLRSAAGVQIHALQHAVGCSVQRNAARAMSASVVLSDPRLVFDVQERQRVSAERQAGEPRCCVPLTLTERAAERLAAGPQFEAAETEEPGNSWFVGEQKEVFEYSAFGALKTQSGFVCAIDADAWHNHKSPAEFQDWDTFLRKYGQELEGRRAITKATHPDISPFLFVGKVVESDSVTVYGDEAGGRDEVEHLAIMSNSEE